MNNPWELNQWSYITSTFEVDEVFVIGPVDRIQDSGFLKRAKIISSVEDLPEDAPIVMAAPTEGRHIQGDVDLKDFVHPENAIYLFGPDNENLSDEHLGARKIKHKVYITNDSRHEFYAHVSAGIFLYDRRSKL